MVTLSALSFGIIYVPVLCEVITSNAKTCKPLSSAFGFHFLLLLNRNPGTLPFIAAMMEIQLRVSFRIRIIGIGDSDATTCRAWLSSYIYVPSGLESCQCEPFLDISSICLDYTFTARSGFEYLHFHFQPSSLLPPKYDPCLLCLATHHSL